MPDKFGKIEEPLDILVEYGYLDDPNIPYHRALNIAVNDFSNDQKLGGDENREILEILQKEARKELKLRRKKIDVSKFFGKKETETAATDTTGTSDLAVRSKIGKIDTKKLIPEPSTEERGVALAKILDGVNSIVETLKDDKKQEKEHKNWLRRLVERFKRRKEENKLEFKIFDGIKKTASKALEPLKSAWSKLLGFLGKVFLGRVLFKILEWMGDKDNQGKLKSIIKFLKDWWPSMLAAYLLFGTGFTKMVAGIIKVVAWSIGKLAILIPKLIAAIAKLKIGKIMKGLGGLLGGKGKAFTGLFSLGAGAFAGGGLVKEVYYYNEGGQVPGSGNKDTVPAMLTPGEVVMSKPAVDKIGADNLLAMNAAGGGTNKPTFMPMSMGLGDGGLLQGFKGGGLVTVPKGTINSYQDLINAGVEVEDVVTGSGRFGSVKWIEKQPKKGLFGREKKQIITDKWYLSGVGSAIDKELAMSTEDYVNMRMGWDVAAKQKEAPKLNRITGDPGERTAPELKRGDNITSNEESKADSISKGEPIYNKRGRIIGYKKTDETKLDLTPVDKKKTKVIDAYNQEKSKMEDKPMVEKSAKEIPKFDALGGRSAQKIKVLGISV